MAAAWATLIPAKEGALAMQAAQLPKVELHCFMRIYANALAARFQPALRIQVP